MTESLEVFNAVDQVRRELIRVNERISDVAERVGQVDRKVEQVNTTQIAALAVSVARGSDLPPEVILDRAEMPISEIAKTLGKTPNSVRITLHRARKKAGHAPNQRTSRNG
jgi:predicted transcriptional regulator